MYSAAQKECNNIGGEAASLASIHDWEENFFIEEEMYWGTDLPKHNDFWIGMTKLKASMYITNIFYVHRAISALSPSKLYVYLSL